MMLVMRTTLTIDDGVGRALKKIAHDTDTPFKDVVDRALRAGLQALGRGPRAKPYRATTFDLGGPTDFNMDKARHLADELENEEILRKMALRK
jgi:hypothetical protein